MLTSFFGKSKPINFVLLGLFLLLGFVYHLFQQSTEALLWKPALQSLLHFGILVFSLLLMDFIIRKNSLTQSNSFGVFAFTALCLLVSIPNAATDLLIAQLCLLFALRRILSLQKSSSPEKKIIDAALWITVATLFYFWSIVLLVGLYIAILVRPQTEGKWLLIPPIGVSVVMILMVCYQLLVNDSLQWFIQVLPVMDLDFQRFLAPEVAVPVVIFCILMAWAIAHRIRKYNSVAKKDRPNYMLVIYLFLVLLVAAILSSVKSGYELLITFGPGSILLASLIERLPTKLTQEITLWLITLLSIGVWFV